MRASISLYVRIAALTLIAVLVTACGGSEGPDAAAKKWFDALTSNDGNTTAALTCSSQQGTIQQGGLALTLTQLMGQDLIGVGYQIDTSGVSFTTLSNSGGQAVVEMRGTIRVAILGISQPQDVDGQLYMSMEGGTWKYCGSS